MQALLKKYHQSFLASLCCSTGVIRLCLLICYSARAVLLFCYFSRILRFSTNLVFFLAGVVCSSTVLLFCWSCSSIPLVFFSSRVDLLFCYAVVKFMELINAKNIRSLIKFNRVYSGIRCC